MSLAKILGDVSGAFVIIVCIYALSTIIQSSIYTIETYVLIGIVLVILILGIFIILSTRHKWFDISQHYTVTYYISNHTFGLKDYTIVPNLQTGLNEAQYVWTYRQKF